MAIRLAQKVGRLLINREKPPIRALIDEKIQVVRELAREYKAIYVPLDGMFASSATLRSPDFWAPDGIHPSQAGHALIANNWLRCIGMVTL